MMVLIRFWRSLSKKDSVERAKYNIQFLFYFYSCFGTFFMDTDPDCSGSDPDFWPIRIRTLEKKSDPDPGKKPGSETLVKAKKKISLKGFV